MAETTNKTLSPKIIKQVIIGIIAINNGGGGVFGGGGNPMNAANEVLEFLTTLSSDEMIDLLHANKKK